MKATLRCVVVGLLASALAGCLPPEEPSQNQSGANQQAPGADNEADQQQQETVKAEVGVGRQGHGYGGDIITEPVRVYFRAKEQITFNNLTHAMRLYEAMNDHAPRSHEEFMTGVIKYNQIRLPELPEGHEYVYDPDLKELMVRRPR